MPIGKPKKIRCGFTLVEMLVVLVLVALLASIATPIVTGSIQRAKEAALREDLLVLRRAIDAFYADKGRYPPDLQTLVDARYIRAVPPDPLTEKTDSWSLVFDEAQDGERGVIDVHSADEGHAHDGSAYNEW